MDNHLKEACESIDASMFSADTFLTATNREELRVYMGRWMRGLRKWDKQATDAIEESNRIINSYDDGKCPDCQEPIAQNVCHEESCPNCEHVFYDPDVFHDPDQIEG